MEGKSGDAFFSGAFSRGALVPCRVIVLTLPAPGPEFSSSATGSLLLFVSMAKQALKRGLGWLAAGLLVLVSGFVLSCTSSEKDTVVLEFNLDSTKLGKSDSLRFEIYNGKAPGPGEVVEPVQVVKVIVQKGAQKVKITLSDKVQSDFVVVVIGYDSTGIAQRKLFEFDDFNPDKDAPPAVLLAVITAANLDMKPGETRAPGIVLNPSDAADRRIILTSTDSSVAAIVGANRDSVKALKDGNAEITVTAMVGGAKGMFLVTVSSIIRIKGITAQPLSGVVGDTLVPVIAFDPPDANSDRSIFLRSLDTGIVRVSGNRLVAKSAGSGKVEVTAIGGGHKDTFDVAIADPVIRLKSIASKPLSGLIGDTLVPDLTFTPAEANDKTFSLRSLDSAVAAIAGTKVVGKAEGKTRVEVTATDGGLRDSFEVTVSKVPIRVKGVLGSNLRGLPGDTLDVDLDWDPVDATDKDFALKSLDTSVARIQASQVVCLSLGTARIEVASGDGGHKDTFEVVVARVAFTPDVLPVTTLKCAPCHIPGQIFNFQDSLVLIRKGAAALDRLQRNPDAPGKMPLKGSANGDLSPRQLGILLDWLKQNVVPLTAMTAKDLNMNFGDTAAPELTFTPTGASNQMASLTSLDSAVVSVTADGRLLPLKPGTATVLAQSDEGGIRAQFKVTVDPPSFQKNVLPITTLKCAPCHVPGQTFDFQDSALLILEGAQALDRLQRDSLAAGKMPLRAAPNGDLTPQQKNVLLAWLNAKVIPLKGITVADDSLLVGQKKAPGITFDPPNASNRSYLLASADTTKVVIDGGEFEGVDTGLANVEVRALDGNFVKIISVKVKPVPVDSLRVTDDAGAIGDTIVPEVQVFPANAAVRTFALSLPNASTILSLVPGNQKLVCLAVGRDTVVATSTDGAKKDSFLVVVGPVLPRSLSVRDTNGVIGQTIPITAVWTPVNTTNKNLTLSLAPADTGKASVSGTSLVAKAVGTATVTARSVADTSLRDTFLFTVGPVTVVSLSVPATVLRCSSTVTPTSLIVWNPTNATNKGFALSLVPATTRMVLVGTTSVRGLKTGITPVTVTSTDGGKTATWNVNVIRTNFTGTVRNVFANKCGECHGPVVWPTRNWQDSAQVVAFRTAITTRIGAVDATKMPPTTATQGALTAAELKTLRDWLSVE